MHATGGDNYTLHSPLIPPPNNTPLANYAMLFVNGDVDMYHVTAFGAGYIFHATHVILRYVHYFLIT